MRTHRLLVVLTLVNAALCLSVLTQARPAIAQQEAAAVVRARALEIVDTRGRVRASISVEPRATIDSRTYPETVLLRLADPTGEPVVKLTASEDGASLGLSDNADGGVHLSAKRAGDYVAVTREGRERRLSP